MGQVMYRDWQPQVFGDPTYNPANAQPQLESWHTNVPRTLPLQPNGYWDNRLGVPSYAMANEQGAAQYTLDELYREPHADDLNRYAPAQPIRLDAFNQLKAIARNQAVAGQAPTKGIYTGTIDLAE